ncbi:hypothetical protein EK21DRAFT_72781, partial [Setomelanomma holmii]
QSSLLRRPGTEPHERSTIPNTRRPKHRPAGAFNTVSSPRPACFSAFCFRPRLRSIAGKGASGSINEGCTVAHTHGPWTHMCLPLVDFATAVIENRRHGCRLWPLTEHAQLLTVRERNGHRLMHDCFPQPGSAG